jgi:hypothetical protein
MAQSPPSFAITVPSNVEPTMSLSFRIGLARVLLIVCAMTFCYPASADPATAADDPGESVPPPDGVAPLADASPLPTWRVGAYVGVLSHRVFIQMILEPWNIDLYRSYLVDLHAVRTLYQYAKLPLDLELQGGVAKRFGEDHQSEIDLIPMARWKSFPWNDHFYTNLRLGLIGASYVSGISPWEKKNSDDNRGSRYLNLIIPELDFARSASAPYEIFVGFHHRSGAAGLINGVSGGSSYCIIGIRYVAK